MIHILISNSRFNELVYDTRYNIDQPSPNGFYISQYTRDYLYMAYPDEISTLMVLLENTMHDPLNLVVGDVLSHDSDFYSHFPH